MPRTPSVVEFPRRRSRRVLIVTDDDNDDDGENSGGGRRAREVRSVIAAGCEVGLGGRRVKEERFDDLGRDGQHPRADGRAAPPLQNPLAPSSSWAPVVVLPTRMPPKVIVIDDDDEDENAHGELQLGEGGGLVKEEPCDDFGVDWDDILSSEGDKEEEDGAEKDEQEEEEEEEKEEEEWEEEEEEEEEEIEEDEEESEEPDEAREESPRRTPSHATAARRNAGAGDGGTEVFGKRLFEGWCIAKKADTTAAASKPLAARLRSHRRCLDTKLLKQGTRSKPYCVDTPSESSAEDTTPPPAQPQMPLPSLSSEECEDNGGRTWATRRRRHRGKNSAHSDDDFKEDIRRGGDHETVARRRRHREKNAHDGDDDGDSEEDRAFLCSRRPKRGAASCRQAAVRESLKNHDASNHQRCVKNSSVPNAGTPTDGCNQQEQGDVSFKKNYLVAPRTRHGRDRETYDDLIHFIFDGIESRQNGSAPVDGSAPAQEQSGNMFPLIFSFGDEDEVVEERTELSKFEDQLWAEFDFALESLNVCSHRCEESEMRQEIPADESTSCNRGKHDLIIDEQIGVRCKNCDFVDLEIRHVCPSMVKFSMEREPGIDSDLDLIFDDIIKSMGYEEASTFGGHRTGLVWDLIPGVREDMFPHQQEGFEFMWKKLAGGIDIGQLKHTVNTDAISGCVISHAPGTGKTRLAITFVQSYLELFPQCRPVIIAPRGMLATWEQEFRKWNVKLPFHVLSSSEIQWNEDKTIKKLIAQDESLGQKLSMNKLSQKSRLMVKLASWYEGSSIIGLSYSLYRRLARDEGMDGDTVRNLLLEKPGLLVLDEGHTPRNKKSLIWKVLAEVSTEKRIILSGTPFQNNFLELYNILCLVKPKFARDFACTRLNKKGFASKRTTQSRATPHLEEDEGKEFWTSLRISNITDENISEIREKLDPFVHIHKGDILQKSLPGLRESVVILNPLPHQKEIITMMEKSAGKGFLDAEYKISLASIHPFLVTSTKLSDEEASVAEKMKSLRLNPCKGVKTRFVLEMVRLCEALKERVLVFSQYLEPLSLIMDQLTTKFTWTEGKEILLMSGNVRVNQREALMEAFNDMNSEAKVMLASTKACCEGITLVGASRVVLLDVVWNPSVGRQAIGRAYRIGQEKIVYIYNLIAEGTKEKVKYDRQAKKDHMSKLLFSNEPHPAGCNLSPELIFSDRILEAMTAHEELKDMFVQILPSH